MRKALSERCRVRRCWLHTTPFRHPKKANRKASSALYPAFRTFCKAVFWVSLNAAWLLQTMILPGMLRDVHYCEKSSTPVQNDGCMAGL
jgi:hypothetical protein